MQQAKVQHGAATRQARDERPAAKIAGLVTWGEKGEKREKRVLGDYRVSRRFEAVSAFLGGFGCFSAKRPDQRGGEAPPTPKRRPRRHSAEIPPRKK